MVNKTYKEEEDTMVNLSKAEPAIKSKKKADYTLNEDKVLEKLKTNLQRGDVHVENTPKNGAKLHESR